MSSFKALAISCVLIGGIATHSFADENLPSLNQLQIALEPFDPPSNEQQSTTIAVDLGQSSTAFNLVFTALFLNNPRFAEAVALSGLYPNGYLQRIAALSRNQEIEKLRRLIEDTCNLIEKRLGKIEKLKGLVAKRERELSIEQERLIEARSTYGTTSSAAAFAKSIVTKVDRSLLRSKTRLSAANDKLAQDRLKKFDAKLDLLRLLDPTRSPLRGSELRARQKVTLSADGTILIDPEVQRHIDQSFLVILAIFTQLLLDAQAEEQKLDEIEKGLEEINAELDQIRAPRVPLDVEGPVENDSIETTDNSNSQPAPPPAPIQQNNTVPSNEEPDPKFRGTRVSTRFEFAAGLFNKPDYELGVQSFNANPNPLFQLGPNLKGPIFNFGVDFGPASPLSKKEGWHGGIDGEYGFLFDRDDATINTFTNPLPTYNAIDGTGGFGFNDNGIVNSGFKLNTFGFAGEAGYRKRIGEKTFLRPYGGLIFRHNKFEADTTLNTDFLGGTFFNTLNEEIRENQFGGDIGLDLTHHFNNGLALTLGGHLGGIFTDSRYTGSDCGDGSTATPGCDGTLFLNNGVGASNDSFDLFGGLKAGLAIFAFCKDRKTEILAGVITAAAERLRRHCVEVTASAQIDFVPTTEINRPTAIGAGQQLTLSQATSVQSRMQFGFRLEF